MSDRRKHTNELVARSAAIGAAVAGLPGAPIVGVLASHGMAAINRIHAKRIHAMVSAAANDGADEEFVERLSRAMLEEDPEVIDGFCQAARSALSALDPAVVHTIGLLLRRSLQASLTPLPRWRLRQYLRFLEELTATEFGDACRMLHGVLKAPALLDEPDRDGVPVTFRRTSSDGWADIVTDLVAAPPSMQRVLCRLRDPERLFDALLAHRLATPGGDDDLGLTINFADTRPLSELMPRSTE